MHIEEDGIKPKYREGPMSRSPNRRIRFESRHGSKDVLVMEFERHQKAIDFDSDEEYEGVRSKGR